MHFSDFLALKLPLDPSHLVSPPDGWLGLVGAGWSHPGRRFPHQSEDHQVGQPEQEQGDEGPVVEEGEHEGKDGDAEEGGGEEGGEEGEEEGGGGLDEREGGWQFCQQRVEVEVIPGKSDKAHFSENFTEYQLTLP